MTLRVATANLFLGRVPSSAVESFIRSRSPDVLALQEMVPSLEALIRELLPIGIVGEPHDGVALGLFAAGPASLSRLRLPSHDALVARLPDGPEVIAVHLPAPHHPPPWETLRNRAGDMAALIRHLESDPDRPRVLLGDLNSSPAWPTYRRLRRFLEDAPLLAAERAGSKPPPTWGPWPGSPRLFRIDHVLVGGLKVIATEVADLPRSDHRALIADLEV